MRSFEEYLAEATLARYQREDQYRLRRKQRRARARRAELWAGLLCAGCYLALLLQLLTVGAR